MPYPEDLPTVRMYHPGLREEIEVAAGSQVDYYPGGWVLVTEEPEDPPGPEEPAAMSRAEVDAHRSGADDKTRAGGRKAGPAAGSEAGSE